MILEKDEDFMPLGEIIAVLRDRNIHISDIFDMTGVKSMLSVDKALKGLYNNYPAGYVDQATARIYKNTPYDSYYKLLDNIFENGKCTDLKLLLDPISRYAGGRIDGRHRVMLAKELGFKWVPLKEKSI